MTHALVDMLLAEERVEPVDAQTIDTFLESGGNVLTCLFFTGLGRNRLETGDVAVVCREFLMMYGNKVRVGVVDEASERDLMARAAVLMLPSIAVFKGQSHLKTFPKIMDWQDYAEGMAGLLSTLEDNHE